MVNFGLNAAAILGLFLAVAGAGLFFLRSVRPELARDYDIFFAAVGLLCGIILLFNGWRLDPILQFGQFLLTGTAVFFAFESIRMRGVATEQARRNTTTVDRDRPVSRSRVYTEAELDKIDPYDDVYEGAKPNYSSPRLRGYDEPQPRPARRPTARRRPAATSDLPDEPRRRPTRSRPEPADYTARTPDDRYEYGDRQARPRRPERRSPAPTTNSYDEWEETPRSASRSRTRPVVEDRYADEPTPTPPSRRRPNPADLGRSYEPEDTADTLGDRYNDVDLGRSYEDEPSIPGDYVVDYQPLDDAESNDADNYDDADAGYDDYDDYDNPDAEYDYDPDTEYDRDDTLEADRDDYPLPDKRKPIDFGNSYS